MLPRGRIGIFSKTIGFKIVHHINHFYFILPRSRSLLDHFSEDFFEDFVEEEAPIFFRKRRGREKFVFVRGARNRGFDRNIGGESRLRLAMPPTG